MSEPTSTAEIWKLLSRKLRGFLRARVGDEQVAEDLLQETFLRIHQGLGELADEERLSAWVFQIARNLVTDHYRKVARGAESLEMEPSQKAPVSENVNDEVTSWLPLAIDLLPEPYREAVRLYELEGLPQQEIAERLGITLSGAKSRVQRGRAKLKGLLDACCAFEIDRRGNVLSYERRSGSSCDSSWGCR